MAISLHTTHDQKKVKFTEEENAICLNIKRQLCDVLCISTGFIGKLGPFIRSHIIKIFKLIDITKAKQLHSEFGYGVFVISFLSVSFFKQRKCMLLPFMEHVIPRKWIFNLGKHNKCYFLSYEKAKIVGILRDIDSIPFNNKSIYPINIKILIYDDISRSEYFVDYDSFLSDFDLKTHLKPFFKEKKWRVTMLREKYPQYLYLFRLNNNYFAKTFKIMRMCLKLHPISDCLFPSNFAEYIKDETQKHQIQKVIKEIYKCYPLSIHEYDEYITSINILQQALKPEDTEYMHSPDMEDVFESVNIKQFVDKAIDGIISIIGEKRYRFIFRKAMKHNMGWKKHMKLLDLMKRIEGRKCSYIKCIKQEQRNNCINEKYKTCSSCRKVFYCSKSCQKRDWNRIHRNNCGRMEYYMFWSATKIGFI